MGKQKKKKRKMKVISILLALIMIVSAVPNVGVNRVKASGYDAAAAVSYAKSWALSRNPQYTSYDSDCANFVSQCLVAGGLPTDYNWSYNNGKAYWTRADWLLEWFKGKPEYSNLIELNPPYSHIQPGDPIFVVRGQTIDSSKYPNDVDHAMICVKNDGIPYIAQHTTDREEFAYSNSVGPNRDFGNAYVVKLHELNGNSTNINNNVSTSDNPGTPYPIPSRNIARGASGDDVKWVQKFANDVMGAGISVDGVSGNQTVYAVQQFQSQQGLTVDGIVGTQTINRMLEVWREYVKPKDTTPPTISNARVTSITANSYTVVANITDSSGISKVQFPTWPSYKTSNGCTWYSPTSVSGSQYTFVLPIKDFSYYAGKYNTHIYAWDNYGNSVCAPINNIGPLKLTPALTAYQSRKKFEVYNSALRWTDAMEFATSKGGRLFVLKDITDYTRFSKVMKTIDLSSKSSYWVGKYRYEKSAEMNGDGYYALDTNDLDALKCYYHSDNYYETCNGNIGFIVEYDYDCNHNWVLDSKQNPTCTSSGTAYYKCSICGTSKEEPLDSLGHSWDGGKVTKTATCTADGTKTYTCTRCKTTKNETIKAKGHKAVTDKAVAATCTKDGKTEGSHCSVCGAVIKKQTTVKAKGHSWDGGKVTKAATATADGVRTYTCKTCKATKTETIKATGTKKTGTTKYNGIDYSKVYDYNYYINKYSDLKKAFGNDDKAAIKHFVTHGMKEGRQAKSSFDVFSYKNKYQDLRLAFGNDLPKYYMHFINHGSKEGRKATGVKTVQNPVTKLNGVDYSKVYDYNYYVGKYSDIKKAFGNDDIATLRHFINNGMREGRQAKSSFDVKSYRRANQDLRTKFGYDWKQYYNHYMKYGYREGRKTTGVKNVQKPVTKYNGVDYSKVYDYNYYTNKYADIKKAFGDDDTAVLKHFVNYGMREARQAKESFNVKSYRSRYEDLIRAYGSNYPAYYMHYINYGYKEGRVGTVKDPAPKPLYLTTTKAYETGNSFNIEEYDSKLKDTYGNSYEHSVRLLSCGEGYAGGSYLTYLLNGKYNHFDMTIGYDVDGEYTTRNGYIKILIDEEVVYTSSEIRKNTKPIRVSLDFPKSANMLTIISGCHTSYDFVWGSEDDDAPILIGSPKVSYKEK